MGTKTVLLGNGKVQIQRKYFTVVMDAGNGKAESITFKGKTYDKVLQENGFSDGLLVDIETEIYKINRDLENMTWEVEKQDKIITDMEQQRTWDVAEICRLKSKHSNAILIFVLSYIVTIALVVYKVFHG